MKKNRLISITAVCVVAIALLLVGYFQGLFFSLPVSAKRAVDTYATDESVSSLSELINGFSFDIYNELIVGNDENIFFSPYSIFVALAMTYEGARSTTADEMFDVLGFPQNDTVNLCSFGRIYNLLNIDKEYTLNTANALWIKEGYPFLTEYLQFIENYYMGKSTEVDFTKSEEAANLINTWVEDNTGGKIKDLIDSSNLDAFTAMILTNAIYFKGDWLNQFDSDLTTDSYFELSDGSSASVPMMSFSDSDLEFNYLDNGDLQILELPYNGNDLSMIVILPKENNITAIEKMITLDNLTNWKDSMYATEVTVHFPKFTIETEYSLKEYLIDLGMNVPFSSAYADFSGMTGRKDLYIDKVKHKAFIEVNEEGTEAAAATSVEMKFTSTPDFLEFNADHPFIYLIQHKETDTILFMGRLSNPE